ncbi:NAD(P)-dependent oxidoreductase [Roseicyclus sp. F158]|uniref:NAD(P)-dependent oxidoreductase n=1 Tax=Tropicimonas omnivorans TaxID=3075590 RepID=A0ABU3DHG9_9RHOB|nr:NAD(P)-dependent oxidoreductase [Roseicyclus sp. F158]MDT0683154.1 NAD(P)-dependent oxidoreductase [Roseicyclus sp. F158]
MRDVKSSVVGVLGGAGRVGTGLRRELGKQVGSIRVLDLACPPDLAENEDFRETDMLNPEDLLSAFEGLDGLVHLAGIPKEASLDEILKINVAGTTNVYEAARETGLDRIVLGSSNHAVGLYPRTTIVGTSEAMRPDGLYGLSKCWSELTAGLYFDKYGLRSMIIRIGNCSVRPMLPRSLEVWISPRDLAQLVLIGLTHPDVTASTVYGVSKGGGSWWDNSEAEKLGYVPQDLIADFAAPEALLEDTEGPVSQHFQGGRFAAADHDGVIRKR